MRSRHTIVSLAACAAAVLGFTFVANSGNLNPPAGAVSPTGRTLSEIYNAVQAIGNGGPTTLAVEPVADIRELISMTVVADSQGNIRGEDTVFGMTEVMRCFGIEHEITVPVTQGGLPTGQAQHGSLKVRKQIDRASPLLAEMATRIERGTVTLRYYKRNTQNGQIQHYYTVVLSNAIITSIASDHTDVSANRFSHEESVSFLYEQIDWTNVIFNTSSSAQIGNPL